MAFSKSLSALLFFGMLWGIPLSSHGEESSLFDVNELKTHYVREKVPPAPAQNPPTAAKELLGRTLFFDPRLSRSGVTSCATCHNPSLDWADGQPRGVGDKHQTLPRKTPSLLNVAWDQFLTWDGRATSLEEQSLDPIRSEAEMGLPIPDMINRLKQYEGYHTLFKKAFPEDPSPITAENVMKALATFERTIISPPSPFDKWIEGDETALSAPAQRGFMLFNDKANCQSCHSGWRFTSDTFNDIGLPSDKDVGRGKIEKTMAMQHAFKTMGLRNIALRAPYMHNGSLKTLMDVINHYDNQSATAPSAQGIRQNTVQFTDNGFRQPLNLTMQEKKDLIAFLHTLTSPPFLVPLPELPR